MNHQKHKEKVERNIDRWLYTTILLLSAFFFLVSIFKIPKSFFNTYSYNESNDIIAAKNISENPYLNGEIEPTGRININVANLETLKQLKGIDDVKAQAIIDYRRDNGNFNNIDEILNVKGIGEKTFEKIKDFITV